MSQATLSPLSETAPQHVAAEENFARGIGFILVSSVLFAVMNTIVKLMSSHLPVTEIGFFRQFLSLIPLVLVMWHEGGVSLLRTRRPRAHLFRGMIGNMAMIPYLFSLHLMPLADATTLTFAAPLFVTALSVPLLGETVGRHRWAAVLVGFAGVVVMTDPSLDWFTSGSKAGAGLGLLSAFLSAVMMITIRQLSKTEAPVTTVFYFAVIGCTIFGSTLPFVWVPPTQWEWAGLAAIGVIGGIAQLVMTHAYRHASAATLAPFNYASILWSTLSGFLIWDQLPGQRMLAGALVVMASGLYIVYRETRRRALPNAAEAVAVQR